MKAYLKQEGEEYNAVLPDKITIFKKPIGRDAPRRRDLKEIVKNTVWHEKLLIILE